MTLYTLVLLVMILNELEENGVLNKFFTLYLLPFL